MAKQSAGLMGIIAWITGIIVSLAVGFGMIYQILTVPFLSAGSNIITVIAGWVVVIGAIISLVMAIFHK